MDLRGEYIIISVKINILNIPFRGKVIIIKININLGKDLSLTIKSLIIILRVIFNLQGISKDIIKYNRYNKKPFNKFKKFGYIW